MYTCGQKNHWCIASESIFFAIYIYSSSVLNIIYLFCIITFLLWQCILFWLVKESCVVLCVGTVLPGQESVQSYVSADDCAGYRTVMRACSRTWVLMTVPATEAVTVMRACNSTWVSMTVPATEAVTDKRACSRTWVSMTVPATEACYIRVFKAV